MVASGALAAGYATEDGVGLHYVNGDLAEVVTIRVGSQAWRVKPTDAGGWTETALAARLLPLQG